VGADDQHVEVRGLVAELLNRIAHHDRRLGAPRPSDARVSGRSANFPQAFSHLALIQAARAIAAAEAAGPAGAATA